MRDVGGGGVEEAGLEGGGAEGHFFFCLRVGVVMMRVGDGCFEIDGVW